MSVDMSQQASVSSGQITSMMHSGAGGAGGLAAEYPALNSFFINGFGKVDMLSLQKVGLGHMLSSGPIAAGINIPPTKIGAALLQGLEMDFSAAGAAHGDQQHLPHPDAHHPGMENMHHPDMMHPQQHYPQHELPHGYGPQADHMGQHPQNQQEAFGMGGGGQLPHGYGPNQQLPHGYGDQDPGSGLFSYTETSLMSGEAIGWGEKGWGAGAVVRGDTEAMNRLLLAAGGGASSSGGGGNYSESTSSGGSSNGNNDATSEDSQAVRNQQGSFFDADDSRDGGAFPESAGDLGFAGSEGVNDTDEARGPRVGGGKRQERGGSRGR